MMNSPWHKANRCAGQDIDPTVAEYIDELVGRVLVGDPSSTKQALFR
jgi:hypothetical protein